MQPRPPSLGGRSTAGSRNSTSRLRSAAKKSVDLSVQPIALNGETLEPATVRPTSSFSKYRPLPAIGSPSPTELEDRFEIVKPVISVKDKSHKHQHINGNKSLFSGQSKETIAISPNLMTPNINLTLEGIEKLDLSQLDKAPPSSRRKKSLTNNTPSSAKQKVQKDEKQCTKNSDLYDADDDDSESSLTGKRQQTPQAKSSNKPVIIPSPDYYHGSDMLLAVKLPRDGTRHQRYFKSCETLHSILNFAEEVASQDFSGYVLVSSAPRIVYKDMNATIEQSGLQDKSVLHMEEAD